MSSSWLWPPSKSAAPPSSSRPPRARTVATAGTARLRAPVPQAGAYVAHSLEVPCRVVMYESAPATKIDGVRRWAATPVLLPRDKVLEWLNTQAWRSEPETFIHPFADPTVMAGHGGIALEL